MKNVNQKKFTFKYNAN